MTTPATAMDGPFKTVVVPTDFSPGARWALERAALLPLAAGAGVHLVHILPEGAGARLAVQAGRRLDEVVSEAERQLGPGHRLSSKLLTGRAFVEIVRCARERSAELIVIGRHGQRVVRDLFIGSTAERVIRKSPIPVLAVNLAPRGPYARPLIATDLGDATGRTVQLALRVLGSPLNELEVVHAFNVPFEGFVTPTASARAKSEYRKSFRDEADAALAAALAPYQRRGVRWKRSVRPGDPRAVILGVARRRRTDLIALGTHARSGVAHAFLGSAAEWVVNAAECDVLVARPPRLSVEAP